MFLCASTYAFQRPIIRPPLLHIVERCLGVLLLVLAFPFTRVPKTHGGRSFLQQYRKNTGISHPQMPIVCCVQVRAHNSHQRRPTELNRRIDFKNTPMVWIFKTNNLTYMLSYFNLLPPYIPAVCCRVLLLKELMFLLYRTYVLFSIRN